jgi:hypothetical protein
MREMVAALDWQDAWLPAAQKYLFPKADSVLGLARRLQLLRDLAKRPLSSAEKFLLESVRNELHEMIVKGGNAFFHRLVKANKIADGKITRKIKAHGAVVLAAAKVFRSRKRRPKRSEIERMVKRWRREGYPANTGELSQRQWNRIFSDSLIARLIEN